MTSYNIEVLKCSECDTEFTFWNVNSCNTFGAMFFTDGSILGPMYDPGVILIGCPSCQNIFWPDERNVVREMSEQIFFKNKNWFKKPSSKKLVYMEVISTKMWRTDLEEKAIRIRAWHEFNSISPNSAPLLKKSSMHAYRRDTEFHRVCSLHPLGPQVPDGYDNVSNLKLLIELLDNNKDDEVLMKAEAFRHLGLFAKAVKLLSLESSNSLLMAWKEKIRELSMNRQTERQLFFKGE
jgi:hypothetical protein